MPTWTSGRRSDGRRFWFRRRTLHGDLRRGPWANYREQVDLWLEPRFAASKSTGTDPEAEMGPLVTKQHLDKVRGYIDAGVAERKMWSRSWLQDAGLSGRLLHRRLAVDRVTPNMKIYKERSLACLAVARAPDYDTAARMINEHEFGNGTSILRRW